MRRYAIANFISRRSNSGSSRRVASETPVWLHAMACGTGFIYGPELSSVNCQPYRLSRLLSGLLGNSRLSELGCRAGQQFPVRTLLLPVHQGVKVGRVLLTISGGLLFAEPVEADDRGRAGHADRGFFLDQRQPLGFSVGGGEGVAVCAAAEPGTCNQRRIARTGQTLVASAASCVRLKPDSKDRGAPGHGADTRS
jgi:hypothetical protein